MSLKAPPFVRLIHQRESWKPCSLQGADEHAVCVERKGRRDGTGFYGALTNFRTGIEVRLGAWSRTKFRYLCPPPSLSRFINIFYRRFLVTDFICSTTRWGNKKIGISLAIISGRYETSGRASASIVADIRTSMPLSNSPGFTFYSTPLFIPSKKRRKIWNMQPNSVFWLLCRRHWKSPPGSPIVRERKKYSLRLDAHKCSMILQPLDTFGSLTPDG